MSIKEWVWKEQRKHHRCACGCGQLLIIKPYQYYKGIPKYISGHNPENEEQRKRKSEKMKGTRMGKDNPRYKGTNEWIEKHTGKHFCQCGCGQEIIILRTHQYVGIPKYKNHHGLEGIIFTEEHRRNLSKAQKGHTHTKCGKENPRYSGGIRATNRRMRSKRRNFKSIELNKDFKGSVGHHINNIYVINIPYKIHHNEGTFHNQFTGQGMKEMNQKAFKYLYENQIDMLVSQEEALQINLICVNKWS